MRTTSLAFAAFLALSGAAFAQQAAEQYIPIGQSPGAVTMQGQVSQPVASGATSIAMTAPGATGEVAYAIGPATRIYIDRSASGQPNTLGTLADLQPGRAIEVCVPDPSTGAAHWIKVRAD